MHDPAIPPCLPLRQLIIHECNLPPLNPAVCVATLLFTIFALPATRPQVITLDYKGSNNFDRDVGGPEVMEVAPPPSQHQQYGSAARRRTNSYIVELPAEA